MDHDRWERVKSVFAAALRVPKALRPAYLELMCRGDGELKREVESLLDSALDDTDFLVAPLGAGAIAGPDPRSTDLEDLELIEEIGRGGMGVVFKARQRSLDRLVAVKFLANPLMAPESQRSAFDSESRIIASLVHPNIVPVHWSGEKDGLSYYVMEYVEGTSLQQVLKDARASGARPPESHPAQAARIVAAVADALEYSHAMGIAHRDIKPGNLIMAPDGTPKVVDFGLARLLDQLSLASRVVGSPHYMSPEQARLVDSRVDQRTDVYSLGVVLYELLTIQKPLEGDSLAELLIAIREREPEPVRRLAPHVPRDLETVCHKAMRKDPAQRYTRAAEFADDLRAILDHRSPRARPPTSAERARAALDRHPVLVRVAAVLLVLLPLTWWAADARSQRARLDEALGRLPDAAGWSGQPPEDVAEQVAFLGELSAGRDGIARLRREFGGLPPEAEARVAQLERAIQDGVQGLRPLLGRALTRVLDDGALSPAGVDLAQVGELSSLLRLATSLADGDPDAELVTALLPRVSLRSQPSGAQVRAQRLDPYTDLPLPDAQWEHLGQTPIVASPLRPGHYRFALVDGTGAYGELIQAVANYGSEYDLPSVTLRAPEPDDGEMVLVEGGPYRPSAVEVLSAGEPDAPSPAAEYDLHPFLADRHEVTNGRYRAFLLATGHAAPAAWPLDWDSDWDSDWDDLPVAFVDVYDAEAYAAWAGKRLLTRLEWSRMARGPDGRDAPWPDDGDPAARANLADGSWTPDRIDAVFTSPRERGWSRDWKEYLLRVRPVGSLPAGQTPEGVLDAMGNVAEWTSTMHWNEVQRQIWRPETGTRLVKGLAFWEHAESLAVDALVHAQAKDRGLGIRCGRSLPADVAGGN